MDSVRQMLARLRETVDRHIWVSQYGMGTVGNGSTSMGGLLRSQDIATQANIALLSAADNDDYSFIDQNFQPESLQTWGKRGAVINVEMRRYQEFVLKGLAADGYTVIDADDCDPDETKEVVQEVKAASKELYAGQCQGVSKSDDVSDAELKKLQEKRVKTQEERYQQRKGELSRRYEVEVTPELVEKDDDGWYPQLR
ncbi:bifunctional DNA primase/helicase, partial [Nostoc sp. FACHB-87]|nr:bifunctional DNA primase/helicase [Nostoc sp. FACHB-87]